MPAPRRSTCVSSTATAVTTSPLKSALVKPTKVVTVGVDYDSSQSSSPLTNDEITVLSMQLRQSKITSIWVNCIDDVAAFVEEQKSAQGNFPGPSSVFYFHQGPKIDQSDLRRAVDAGVDALALDAGAAEHVFALETEDIPIIWKVSNPKQVMNVMKSTEQEANTFLIDSTDAGQIDAIVDVIPENALRIALVDAMQPDGAEIQTGRSICKNYRCSSILARSACVGDVEDVEFSRQFAEGITSKKSSEFQFSGLTGSTNGHFGGVQASGGVKWRRKA